MASEQVQYNIGGMSCSFCAETINKAYGRREGVRDVDVSLAHEELLVEYDADKISEVEVKDVVRDLGYTIRDPDKERRFEQQQEELVEGKRHLWISGLASILTFGLMAVMIARNGWNIFAETDALWMWYGSLSLALVTMFWPGLYIKEKAWQSLKRGILNQHVLLEAGAFAGLAGGFLGWFVFTGDGFPVVHFFAVSTFITTYHILSEYTSLVVRTRASRAVNDLMDLQPETARRVTKENDVEDAEDAEGADDVEEVEVGDLEVGDRVRVRPGESIPTDGEVVDGESAVDESVATGESAPIDKRPGDDVIGGSVNETGTLLIEVTATGEDAFLNRVARQIEEARAMKPDIVQLADRILKYFVPGVLSIAVAAFVFWTVVPTVVPGTVLGTGPQFETATFAALAALVLGYPCALGMATPLALIRGGGEAARNGILMRSGDAFQVFRDVDHIVLDKTGTVTEGEPAVDTVVGLGDHTAIEVLRTAASAETFSEHPLAAAILDHADARGVSFPDPESFDSVTGKGVRATVELTGHRGADGSNGESVERGEGREGGEQRDSEDVLVGKPGWLDEEGIDLSMARGEIERLQARGLTTIGVVASGEPVGVVGIGDDIKSDATETIDRMNGRNITPVMITGDNARTAHAVAEAIEIERVMADVLPDDKRDEVEQLQDEGHRVAMVGDGINDAPALTQADVGVAIGAGTDIAIESADIVLMGDRLGGVMDAYEIGEESYAKTKQNLIAAFSFNGIGVSAAVTGLVHPVFAMIAMITSVSLVLANSFAGQLLSEKGIKTDFSVETVEPPTEPEPEPEPEPDVDGAAEPAPEPAPEPGAEDTATASDGTFEADKLARETVTYDVDLNCGGCEDLVADALGGRDGVRDVEAEADTRRVEVTFDPHQISADDLRDTLGELGYTITVVKAPEPAD